MYWVYDFHSIFANSLSNLDGPNSLGGLRSLGSLLVLEAFYHRNYQNRTFWPQVNLEVRPEVTQPPNINQGGWTFLEVAQGVNRDFWGSVDVKWSKWSKCQMDVSWGFWTDIDKLTWTNQKNILGNQQIFQLSPNWQFNVSWSNVRWMSVEDFELT